MYVSVLGASELILRLLQNLSAPGSPVPLDDKSYTSSLAFIHSLKQAPSVVQAMWPSNLTTDDQIGTVFQRGLSSIMTDIPTFLAFCANGTFSSSRPPAFDARSRTVPLAAAASTYTTSTILQADGWYAVPGTVANMRDTAPEGCTALGKGGFLCVWSKETAYQSAVTGRLYYFKYHGKGSAPIAGADVLKRIDEGLAVTPVLFDGAYNCTLEGSAGKLVNVDTACLSKLPIYLPKKEACPQGAVQVDGKCPFGYE